MLYNPMPPRHDLLHIIYHTRHSYYLSVVCAARSVPALFCGQTALVGVWKEARVEVSEVVCCSPPFLTWSVFAQYLFAEGDSLVPVRLAFQRLHLILQAGPRA